MTDGESTNILDQAIGQIEDETLRKRISREVELLRDSRHFGLVFDRHIPESVRLRDHPIRKGVKVTLRNESTTETWRVLGFTDRTRKTALLSGDGGEQPVDDLVVEREFGEPVYPGLQRIEEPLVSGGSTAPWHTVINGENFHALQALRSTHRGQIDLIYIDPPYNTGAADWIYSDRHVAPADRSKSSKWLSFMERRLTLARDLLKETGVIIVAIGDDEHHRLRMLMDQVFDPDNFISDVVWQGGTNSYARYASNVTDYMLIYAQNEAALSALDTRWRERKPGVDKALEAATEFLQQAAGDAESATVKYKEWLASLPASSRVAGIARYDTVEEETGRLYSPDGDMGAPESRPNRSRKPIIHPVTGRPCPVPQRGWRWSDEELNRRLDEGLIAFGSDETKMPRLKRYLDEMDERVLDNVFAQERNRASMHLSKVLGDRRFPFPKDHEVLMRWFRIAAPKDAVILDFFGGSGSTTEAVMRLNAEDGGTRQSVLVTNNELSAQDARKLRKADHHPGDPGWEAKGVFEYVCRPRIETVVTGERPDGSHYSDGLGANVEFFELTYLDPGSVRRGEEFERIAPLLWLEAGGTDERIEQVPEAGWALTGTYGVLFDIDVLADFAGAVAKAASNDQPPRVVFIVTDSPVEYQTAAERLPVGIETVRLYQDYLSNYTINTEGSPR